MEHAPARRKTPRVYRFMLCPASRFDAGAECMQTGRTSIGIATVRALRLSLLVVALLCIPMSQWLAGGAANRSEARAARLLASGIVASCAENNEWTLASWRSVCDRLVAEPDILAARVWDADSLLLAERSVDGSLLSVIASPARGAECLFSFEPVTAPSSFPGGSRLARVDVTLQGGSAGETPIQAAIVLAMGQTAWAWWAAPLLVGLCCVILAIVSGRYLHSKVDKPLALLSRQHFEDGLPAGAVTLVGRRDEWGDVARCIVNLHESAEASRNKADRAERRVAAQLAEQSERIMRDMKRLQREAWMDPLTGVKNRRMMEEKLPALFASQMAAGQDMSLVMIDLDHFKKLNDAEGHRAGDALLRFAGELLRQCMRNNDVAIRYGGDEFVLILPGINALDACAITRRIASLFAQRVRMMVKVEPRPTMTAGIASLHENRPPTPAALLACADHALYQAKESGRGRARICQPDYRPPQPHEAHESTPATR